MQSFGLSCHCKSLGMKWSNCRVWKALEVILCPNQHKDIKQINGWMDRWIDYKILRRNVKPDPEALSWPIASIQKSEQNLISYHIFWQRKDQEKETASKRGRVMEWHLNSNRSEAISVEDWDLRESYSVLCTVFPVNSHLPCWFLNFSSYR